MALTFDGANDVVSYGNIAALDGAAAFTIALWCSFDEAGAAANDGFVGQSTTGATNGFSHIANNGGSGFRFFIGSTAYNKTTMFASTAYSHLAIVYDGAGAANEDRLKVYLNGVNQTADSFTGTIPSPATATGAGPFKIGRSADDLGFAAGSFDHVKVWTAALSAGDVLQEVYSFPPVRTQNLLLWTPYDGGVAVDYSGNALNGTVTEAVAATGPEQVNYGIRVLTPSRSRLGARRDGIVPIRKLGPMVPLYSRGV